MKHVSGLMRDPSWIWILGKASPEVQNRSTSGPQKTLWTAFFKKPFIVLEFVASIGHRKSTQCPVSFWYFCPHFLACKVKIHVNQGLISATICLIWDPYCVWQDFYIRCCQDDTKPLIDVHSIPIYTLRPLILTRQQWLWISLEGLVIDNGNNPKLHCSFVLWHDISLNLDAEVYW